MKRILLDKLTRRRAAAAIMTLITLPVIIGFAALTIDVAVLYGTRADLQNAADAAALAGASELASDAMMQVRMGVESGSASTLLYASALDRASDVSALIQSFGRTRTLIEAKDVALGTINLNSGTEPMHTGVPAGAYNAVRVITRREERSSNGPVEFFFAPALGHVTGDVSASAVGAFDDRVSGFDPGSEGGPYLVPFTIDKDYYDTEFASGADQYEYDSGLGTVNSGADGVREINLYPLDLVPGNFGLLNIGRGDESSGGVADHIVNGVPPEDLEAEIGTSELTFSDGAGNPVTHSITGNPGMKSTLESDIELRVGDVVAFLLHDQAVESGSNATYRITSIRFGRVMDVMIQGSSKTRGLWIQPVSFYGAGVKTSPLAASTGGTVGRIVLVR
ncbi:MAG: pilus assembly protein TadG-related protein [Phycisphaerae bacterium]|jgi:hypothetical protein